MKMEMAVLARENIGGCELVRVGYRPAEPFVGGSTFWEQAAQNATLQEATRLIEQEITDEDTSQGTYRKLLAVRDALAEED